MPINVEALRKRKEQLSDEMDRLEQQMQQMRKRKAPEQQIDAIDARIDTLQDEYLRIGDTLKKALVKDGRKIMSVEKKIDEYLNEEFAIDQDAIATAVSSLSTGMRRVQYKLQKANTPQKYTEAFNMVSALVANFPLKSKIIWKMVADEFHARSFGGVEAGAPSEN